MTGDLPQGWKKHRLGDVLTLINGRAYKRREMLNSGTPILRIQNLNGKENWFYSDLELPENKYCEEGDLLYAWSATFGPYWYRGEKAIFHYHIWNVKTKPEITKGFAYYELLRITDAIKGAAHGVAMPHMTKTGMENWEIFLSPLPEQKRIVDKLDCLLAKVNVCKSRLDKVPEIIKRFRQSVLADATSGKLTEGWREELNLGIDKWRYPKIEEIIESGPQNGLYKPATFYGDYVNRIVRIGNFYSGEFINWAKTKKLKLDPEELEKWALNQDDILINRVNSIEFLGKSTIVTDLPGDCVFESNIMRFTVNKNSILPRYLVLFLGSGLGLNRLRENAKHAVNQASINQTDVKNVIINLPGMREQKEIVRRVDVLFSIADQMEEKLETAQHGVDKLTASILAKAFRGELVPQDPNDELAEKLKNLNYDFNKTI